MHFPRNCQLTLKMRERCGVSIVLLQTCVLCIWDIEGILNLKCKAVYKKVKKVTIHSQFAGKRSYFSDFGGV